MAKGARNAGRNRYGPSRQGRGRQGLGTRRLFAKAAPLAMTCYPALCGLVLVRRGLRGEDNGVLDPVMRTAMH